MQSSTHGCRAYIVQLASSLGYVIQGLVKSTFGGGEVRELFFVFSSSCSVPRGASPHSISACACLIFSLSMAADGMYQLCEATCSV